MKRVFMAAALLFCAAVFAPGRALAEDKPQTITAFGNEICDIMKASPAGLMDVLPLRYVMRIALASEAGGEDELYDMAYAAGMTIDDLIDMTLEDSGMLEEGAGADYFGEEPIKKCVWSEPETVDCDNMFIALAEYGLMVGTIEASFDSLVNAGIEQELQACAGIRVKADAEDLTMALLMFDNLWYMVTAFENE